MKSVQHLVLCLGLGLLLAGLGCATSYKVTLNDGTVIQTQDEPELNEKTGFYEFKDEKGKKVRVNRAEVRDYVEN